MLKMEKAAKCAPYEEVCMKKYLSISLSAVIMIFMCAVSGQAERHHGGGGGSGWWPVVGLGLGLGMWELSQPYYAYPYNSYYSTPPVIIQQQSPDVYIQSAPQYVPAPQTTEPVYWYYCQEAQGYYPYVKQCPQGWMKVVPTPPAPQNVPQPAK